MPRNTSIRSAQPRDAAILSALAMRSKAHWGYSPEFMEKCREELAVSVADILDDDLDYRLAETNGTAIGFYALESLSDDEFELEALFVDPVHIGTGTGRLLMQHALHNAAGKGARVLRIQGDPNAARFYAAAGAEHVGERESCSIPGRMLPLYEIRLLGESR